MALQIQSPSVLTSLSLTYADLVAKHIQMNLDEKSKEHMFHLNALAKALPHRDELPSNVIILPQTSQLRTMTTIIRDKDTNPEDYIFYLERTSDRVIERYLRYDRF